LDIVDFVADVDLSMINTEFMSCALIGNVIFKGVHKLFISFDTIDICDLSVSSTKTNGSCGSIISSWDIIINNVTSNRRIIALDSSPKRSQISSIDYNIC
jgi:hypothetical protein